MNAAPGDISHEIRFESNANESARASLIAAWQVTMVVRNPRTGTFARPRIGLRVLMYLPICIFVALSVAAPWRDRRRVWQFAAFGAGAALLAVFLAGSLAAAVLSILSDDRIAVVPLSRSFHNATHAITATVIEASYIAPALAWLAGRWLVATVAVDRVSQTSS